VALALAWVAVIEGIVGQLVGSDLARWLPFAASQALDRANITGSRLLPQWGGGLVLLAYTAIFAGAAIVTTLRRDVT
jgi:ABC-2 type transport system permease protein